MTCTCGSVTSTRTPGATSSTARTFVLGAGTTETIDGQNSSRRSVLIVNQSAGALVVAFGATQPVAGGGPGITIGAGQSLSVATTAEVQVHNPQAAAAQLGYVTEQD